MATIHGRDLIQRGDLRLDGRQVRPQGRLARRHGRLPAAVDAEHLPRSLHVPSDLQVRGVSMLTCVGVFTNKTPTDAYRGAGRPEAKLVIERLADDLAAELDGPAGAASPQPDQNGRGSCTTVSPTAIAAATMQAATWRAEEFDYAGMRFSEQDERRRRKDLCPTGLHSTATARCRASPSRWLGEERVTGLVAGSRHRAGTPSTDAPRSCRASSPHGQGLVTTFAQIASTRCTCSTTSTSSTATRGRADRPRHQARLRARRRPSSECTCRCPRRSSKARRGTAPLPGGPSTSSWSAVVSKGRKSPGNGGRRSRSSRSPPRRTTCRTWGSESISSADLTADPDNLRSSHLNRTCEHDSPHETEIREDPFGVAVDDIGVVVNPPIVDGQAHGARHPGQCTGAVRRGGL